MLANVNASGIAALELEKVQPVSMRSQVVGRIREAILNGGLKPGQRLVERKLGQAMGTSQVTVREALQQLEHEGLVTKKANTATFVTELSVDKFREILQVRLQLEPYAMRLASRRLTPEGERTLQALVEEINQAIAKEDPYATSSADFRFHQTIWHMSGNETLARTLTQLCNPYFAYVTILAGISHTELGQYFASEPAFTEYFKRDMKARVQSHQRLLEAVKHGGTQEIDAAVGEHISGTWGSLLDESELQQTDPHAKGGTPW